MAYVKIPKDLSDIETKVVMGLTKRQLICFAVGAVIGFPLFFLLRPINNTVAGITLVGATIPAFAFAIYKKNGMPLEKFIRIVFRFFVKKKKRPYVTENYYAALTRYYNYYEEVKEIVREKEAPDTAAKRNSVNTERAKSNKSSERKGAAAKPKKKHIRTANNTI